MIEADLCADPFAECKQQAHGITCSEAANSSESGRSMSRMRHRSSMQDKVQVAVVASTHLGTPQGSQWRRSQWRRKRAAHSKAAAKGCAPDAKLRPQNLRHVEVCRPVVCGGGPLQGHPRARPPPPPIPGRPLQCLLPYSRRQSPAVTPLRHAVGLVQADERQLVRHPLQLLEERRRAPAFDGGWRATMGRPPPTHCPPPAGGDWVGLCLAGGPWGKAVNARRPFGGGDPRRFFLCKPFSRLDTSETKELLCFSFDPSPGCIPWSRAITRQ